MVPSAVHLVERPGLRSTGSAPGVRVARRFFLGRTAFIGRAGPRSQPDDDPPGLRARASRRRWEPRRAGRWRGWAGRPVERPGGRARLPARAAGRDQDGRPATGSASLVVAAPVSAFETYRAEVQRILRDLGVRTVRFVDEPLAVALGYGLGLTRREPRPRGGHRRRHDAHRGRAPDRARRRGRAGPGARQARPAARRQRRRQLGPVRRLRAHGIPDRRVGRRRGGAVLAPADARRGLPREGGRVLRGQRHVPAGAARGGRDRRGPAARIGRSSR